MAQYGRHQYRLVQYGKYELPGEMGRNTMGARLRMRVDGQPFVETRQASLQGEMERLRIRSNLSAWLYGGQAQVAGRREKVRLRAIGPEGTTPWVMAQQRRIRSENG